MLYRSRLEQCLNEVKDESLDVIIGTWLKGKFTSKNVELSCKLLFYSGASRA
jgi:hypothetical protein